jgi:hypothetical protein
VLRGSGSSLAQLLHGHRRLACTVSQPALLSAVDDGCVLPVSDVASNLPECLRVITWHSGVSPVTTWQACVHEVGGQLQQLAARFGGAAPPTRVIEAHMHSAYSWASMLAAQWQGAFASAGGWMSASWCWCLWIEVSMGVSVVLPVRVPFQAAAAVYGGHRA